MRGRKNFCNIDFYDNLYMFLNGFPATFVTGNNNQAKTNARFPKIFRIAAPIAAIPPLTIR